MAPPKDRCGLVADLAAEGIPVEVSCRVLKVSTAGYYNWRTRPPSQRAIRHAWLTDVTSAAHADSRGTYGSRRIHAELVKGQGLVVGYHRVTMLMARAGLSGVPNRRTRFKAPGPATAVDLVDRLFARTAPDQLWVTT